MHGQMRLQTQELMKGGGGATGGVGAHTNKAAVQGALSGCQETREADGLALLYTDGALGITEPYQTVPSRRSIKYDLCPATVKLSDSRPILIIYYIIYSYKLLFNCDAVATFVGRKNQMPLWQRTAVTTAIPGIPSAAEWLSGAMYILDLLRVPSHRAMWHKEASQLHVTPHKCSFYISSDFELQDSVTTTAVVFRTWLPDAKIEWM